MFFITNLINQSTNMLNLIQKLSNTNKTYSFSHFFYNNYHIRLMHNLNHKTNNNLNI